MLFYLGVSPDSRGALQIILRRLIEKTEKPKSREPTLKVLSVRKQQKQSLLEPYMEMCLTEMRSAAGEGVPFSFGGMQKAAVGVSFSGP